MKFVWVVLFILVWTLQYAWALEPRTAQFACNRLNSGYESSCYELIRGMYFDPYATGECDSYSNQESTLTCLQSIAGAHFQREAVLACDRIQDTASTTDCLIAVANKHYTVAEVAQCDSQSDGPSTTECFTNSGIVPPVPTPRPRPHKRLVWNEADRSCNLVSGDGKVLAKKTPKDCILAPSTEFAWADEAHQKCAAYSAEEVFIDFVKDKAKCESDGLECLHGSGILASSSTALIEGSLYHLLPQVLKLQDNETIPAQIYQRYDSRLIAASLIKRFHKLKEEGDTQSPDFDYYKDTLLQMRFDESQIASIAQNGFLNQHQTGHADGSYVPKQRAGAEDQYTGVRLEENYRQGADNPVNSLRPKYSFLGFTHDPDGEKHSVLTRTYGNVVAVFKNEVKDRTTFTPGDALATKGENFHTLYYRSEDKLSLNAGDNNQYPFWEAQIWGRLGLSDVAYFLVDCPRDPKLHPQSLDPLKKTGVPIYRCRFLNDHSHFEKGEVVSAGDPKLAPGPDALVGSDSEKLKAEPAPTPAPTPTPAPAPTPADKLKT